MPKPPTSLTNRAGMNLAPPLRPGDILSQTDHRPWSLPRKPWVMAQSWHDLMFMHWRIDPAALRPMIPERLEIETFDGSAWIAVVPFHMSHIRLHYGFRVPWISAFAELNVRTYVTDGQKPGVWFFSLDAAQRIGVDVARASFHLPYFHARMRVRHEGEAVHYSSVRMDRRGEAGEFHARYKPTSRIYFSQPGTLEHFLTERYALYAQSRRGRLYRGEIHHAPWPLQPAQAEVRTNTVCDMHGIRLPDEPPLLHFARRIDVLAWYLERV